jgi:putative transposase
MTRIQFQKGLRLVWQGHEYIIWSCIHDGQIQLKDRLTNHVSTLKVADLIESLFQGKLEFLLVDDTHLGNQNNHLAYSNIDFTTLSTELKEPTKRRFAYIKRVLELNIKKLNISKLKPIIEQVSNEINDTHPPSALTVHRWFTDYLASGQDIRALIPKHLAKGNRQPRLQPEVRTIINNTISQVYLKPEQASGTDVYNRVVIEINQCNRLRKDIGQEKLEIPNIAAIYRAIQKLDSYEKANCRYGKRMASQMYDPVFHGPRPTRPLERVEIDHTKLPLFVVDTKNRLPIGTPWLTSAVDKYSGIILGYYASFEPPSYLSVMQCLLHAIRPKDYLHTQYPSVENTWDVCGLPEVIVVDNAKEFYSTHFEDACLQLGVVIQYSPPKMPWYKSSIERFFGTLNTQLLNDKPGKNFSNFFSNYDYNPLKNAVISFEALQEILHIFIVDIHHQSSHPQMKSSRIDVWNTAISQFPPALPTSCHELNVLIGNITTRKITRKGVEFEGLIYNSCELAQIHYSSAKSGKTVVKYDPTDLSRIYVFNSNTHNFLEVPALAQDYTSGLSLWQHQLIKQLARQEASKIDITALSLAKQKIQQIVEQEWKTSNKSKTRTAMARWLGITSGQLSTGNSQLSPLKPTFNSKSIYPDDHAQLVNNSSSSLSEIVGISDLGSEFNSHLSLSEVRENKVDSHHTSAIGQTSVELMTHNLPENLAQQKLIPSDITQDQWKPDLSGWDISIGLPPSV